MCSPELLLGAFLAGAAITVIGWALAEYIGNKKYRGMK